MTEQNQTTEKANKLIMLSQRVDEEKSYQERRDGLDQRWAQLLEQCQLLAVPAVNRASMLPAILRRLTPDGVLLTGGNSPVAYGGQAAERDAIDQILIRYALQRKIPLLGVCRGMQSIALYFGSTLKPVTGHRAIRHPLSDAQARDVNSYHQLAIDTLSDDLMVLAYAKDQEIEAIRHKTQPIYGIMWHPERETPFAEADLAGIRHMFGIDQ